MSTVSICIPTYEMQGLGAMFLAQSFDILAKQTFKSFTVIVSDHSKDTAIETLCATYADRLHINYYRYTEKYGNSSANLNNAIRNANGRLIKILFQDDFLYADTSLATIVEHFDKHDGTWLVSACEHSPDGTHYVRPFYPRYNPDIHLGNNTISSPSVLTIKNERPLLFDENLIWLMDCDYYRRCYDAFGAPLVLDTITVVNRTGDHQITNSTATETLKYREYLLQVDKYEHGIRRIWLLIRGTCYALARILTHRHA